MVRHLNGYLLKLIYHKISIFDGLFSKFSLMIKLVHILLTMKSFPDETLLFSITHNIKNSRNQLNKDLLWLIPQTNDSYIYPTTTTSPKHFTPLHIIFLWSWYFEVFHFSIYNIRMKQTFQEDNAIKSQAVSWKFFIEDWPT